MEGSDTVRTVCLNMQKQSESTNCNELDAVGNALVATVKKITVAHRQQQCWIHPKKKQGTFTLSLLRRLNSSIWRYNRNSGLH
ncbi:hypothetical protein WN943_012452 [Citrus x changshan-huyou]